MNADIPAKPQYLTLDEAARELRICDRTLAALLRDHPAEPPLFARIGKKYLISPSDLSRIYETMKCRSASSAEAGNTSISAPPSQASIYLKLRALTASKRQQLSKRGKGRQTPGAACAAQDGGVKHGRLARRVDRRICG